MKRLKQNLYALLFICITALLIIFITCYFLDGILDFIAKIKFIFS